MSRRKIKDKEPYANAVFIKREREYEQSLNDLKKLTHNKHGGKRKGSGRKKKESTKVMRIRLSKVAEVERINKS